MKISKSLSVVRSLAAVLVTLFVLTGGAAHATVIFNDTSGFSNWYKGGTDSGTLTTGGATLGWSSESTSDAWGDIGRTFTSTALSVGETMTATFNWTQSISSIGIFRVGLYDATNAVSANGWSGTATAGSGALGDTKGYYGFVRDASASGNKMRLDSYTQALSSNTVAPLQLAGTEMGSNTTNYDFSNDGTVTYTVSFSVKNVGSNQINTTFTILDGATEVFNLTGTRTDADAITTFDSLFIRSNGGTMNLDNISVSVVPEPGSISLLAVGGLGLLAFGRRFRRG